MRLEATVHITQAEPTDWNPGHGPWVMRLCPVPRAVGGMSPPLAFVRDVNQAVVSGMNTILSSLPFVLAKYNNVAVLSKSSCAVAPSTVELQHMPCHRQFVFGRSFYGGARAFRVQ